MFHGEFLPGEFAERLWRPRVDWVMLPAGYLVDKMIGQLAGSSNVSRGK